MQGNRVVTVPTIVMYKVHRKTMITLINNKLCKKKNPFFLVFYFKFYYNYYI